MNYDQASDNLVRECVPIPQKTYRITKRLKTLEEVEKYFPGFMVFIDSTTEQQIPRSIDNKRKKMFYSGKKKRHTVKNQLTVNKDGYILHKVAYKKGLMIMMFIRITILSFQNKLLL